MTEKRFWFWDLETLSIFTATFVDRDSDEIRTFVLSDDKNEIPQMLEFLSTKVAGLIGYNSLYFDSQILEYIIDNPKSTAVDIQQYATKVIASDDKPDYPYWELRHKHLDLFKALSLSVKAKRTSLKWCQFQMDYENLEDFDFDDPNITEEKVLAYNLNDVLSTKALYFREKHQIELRKAVSKTEGVDVLNSTEPDISKKLFLKWLAKAMNVPEYDLKQMGTDRTTVNVDDIILPYIKFETEKFNNVLKTFRNLSLSQYDSFNHTIKHQGIEICYGLGGLHAAPKNKRFDSDDKNVIVSFDFASFYPHISFKNNISPAHIPDKIFTPLYKGLYDQRKSIPKSNPKNYILKIALNSAYGLSNDKYSFLRDRQMTVAICINGQLILSMLMEKLLNNIPNSQLIMLNTDGGELIIPRKHKDKYDEICNWMVELCGIELEHVEYKSLIIGDVNNYIGIYADGKTKCKGRFEFENIPLHKNKSHSIIPRAVYEYFVNNIPIEQTIKNHQNIFDFCAGVKARSTEKKGKAWYELHSINNSIKKYSYEEKRNFFVQQGYIEIAKDLWRHPDWQDNMTGISTDDYMPKHEPLSKQKLNKVVRYFISNKGQWLFKCYEDGSQAHVEAPHNLGKMKKDWKITYFNKAYQKPIAEYNIDYSYYIYKAREWIYQIEDKQQLTLF